MSGGIHQVRRGVSDGLAKVRRATTSALGHGNANPPKSKPELETVQQLEAFAAQDRGPASKGYVTFVDTDDDESNTATLAVLSKDQGTTSAEVISREAASLEALANALDRVLEKLSTRGFTVLLPDTPVTYTKEETARDKNPWPEMSHNPLKDAGPARPGEGVLRVARNENELVKFLREHRKEQEGEDLRSVPYDPSGEIDPSSVVL